MSKVIDLNKSVYELVKEYPEIVDLMAEIGFTEIRKKPVLHSVGKIMTIPKGSVMKNIPMEKIRTAFEEAGFTLLDGEPCKQNEEAAATLLAEEKTQKEQEKTNLTAEERNRLLKSYLTRLGEGEDLESVRRDFVSHFKDVEASEIMKAEQDLIRGGAPIAQVQKLCDVHSALFHGKTREEKIANAENAARAAMQKERAYTSCLQIKGHPLALFKRENDELRHRIVAAKKQLEEGQDIGEELAKIRDLSIHYAKKGDLLYPHLQVKYAIEGPSKVMWTVDDEIRDEMASLCTEPNHGDSWKERAGKVLDRADEMIYKEENILFPICAVNFSEEEWRQIYHDEKDYAICLGVKPEIWEDAERESTSSEVSIRTERTEEKVAPSSEVVLGGGHLTLEQLNAMLNTIPLELTFVDADDINRFFNESEGPKFFKRPSMAIDREVYSCHPPKIEPIVREIIEGFKSGKVSEVPVWMEKGGHAVLVRYIAVRDKEGKYIGTLEAVQDMEFAREHFKKK